MLKEFFCRVRETERFFELLHHNLAGEERIQLLYKSASGFGEVSQEFHSSPGAAAFSAAKLGEDNEVYAGVAARFGMCETSEYVCSVSALWVSLPIVSEHTHKSRSRQLKILPYTPSFTVWTGGGLQAYWLLHEPVRGERMLSRAEFYMRSLELAPGSEPVHDRAWLSRVPGTMNHAYDRPRSVELRAPEIPNRYDLEQLANLSSHISSAGLRPSSSDVPRGVLVEEQRDQREPHYELGHDIHPNEKEINERG